MELTLVILIILVISYFNKWIALAIASVPILILGGHNSLVEKIIEARKPAVSTGSTVPSWLSQFTTGPPPDVRAEVLELESRIGERKIDPIAGSLDITADNDSILVAIKNTLLQLVDRQILVDESEFTVDDNWYPQRAINLHSVMQKPDSKYADVTRIFGADYLKDVFSKNNNASLDVPKYKLLVKDKKNINVVLTCSSKYGLVLHGIEGSLYAEKITGVPKMKSIVDLTAEASGQSVIRPGNVGFYDYYHDLYKDPQEDMGKILISSRWEDYGPGLGSVKWDNVLYNGKYYFIDTELKSFHQLYKDDDLGQYLRERYIVSRGGEYSSRFDTYFTVSL